MRDPLCTCFIKFEMWSEKTPEEWTRLGETGLRKLRLAWTAGVEAAA